MSERVCRHSLCNKTLGATNQHGWCSAHHNSIERQGIEPERSEVVRRVCRHSGCDTLLNHNNASGWCWYHNASGERRRIDENWRTKRDCDYRHHWRALDAKQANLCAVCGNLMHDDVTVDHIYPVHLGGGDELDNLQAVHKGCNSGKGARYDLFALAGVHQPVLSRAS